MPHIIWTYPPFFGIFHTTPIIDIHMILFGLDKSTLKVYEKKTLFILHNFYIKYLSIFLAPPKKTWLLCGCFLREESCETQNLKRFRFSMSVDTVRSRIINFYAKIIKWRLSKKNFEKWFFFSDFLVSKSTENNFFYIILGQKVAIRVPNMHIKFRKDRSSSFGEKTNTAWKKVVSRKTRLKFFSMKNRKKMVLTANQPCRHLTFCFDFLKSIFLIVFLKLIKWDDLLTL